MAPLVGAEAYAKGGCRCSSPVVLPRNWTLATDNAEAQYWRLNTNAAKGGGFGMRLALACALDPTTLSGD
jgi:hypothetical protein